MDEQIRKGIIVKSLSSCFGRTCLAVVVLVLLLCDGHPLAWSAEGENPLGAGIVKVDITPNKPVKMSGYAGRKELSSGVHDQLYARIVAFESGNNRLILVSTDLIGFYSTYEPIRDAICDRFDLKPDELFLSSTHTHSGPTPALSEDGHPNNLEYTQNLKLTLLKAVGQAIEKIRPVRMGTGRGYSPLGSNRREVQPDGAIRLGRNPYGPTDKEVLVMKVTTPDGTPVAALFDYATHATSLGPRNLQISGDVLGLAAQFVEFSIRDRADVLAIEHHLAGYLSCRWA